MKLEQMVNKGCFSLARAEGLFKQIEYNIPTPLGKVYAEERYLLHRNGTYLGTGHLVGNGSESCIISQ